MKYSYNRMEWQKRKRKRNRCASEEGMKKKTLFLPFLTVKGKGKKEPYPFVTSRGKNVSRLKHRSLFRRGEGKELPPFFISGIRGKRGIKNTSSFPSMHRQKGRRGPLALPFPWGGRAGIVVARM